MSRRTLLILLFVSLALNLFVIGAAAGAFVFGERMHHHRPDFRAGPPMMAAAAVLPADQQDAYRQALSGQAAVVRPKLREAHQLRRAAWARLSAEPVDAQSVTADLDRARTLESEARADLDRAILDFAVKLPPADRARLGQALAQPPHRGRGPPPP